MIVFRKTMAAAVDAERERGDMRLLELTRQYGGALNRVTALQSQLEAWVTGKTEGAISPEQFAQMFWANDNRWQAGFFNALQGVATACWEARRPSKPNEYVGYLGVPAGEGQWCYMADDLDDSGFETLEAMYDHAKYVREKRACDSGSRSESRDDFGSGRSPAERPNEDSASPNPIQGDA